jgi:hypothetical protein
MPGKPKDVPDKRRLYSPIIEAIFHAHYEEGNTTVPFARSEIAQTAEELGIKLPKNLGDVIYSFKFRSALPESIIRTAPANKEWVIVNRGQALYAFELRSAARILPDPAIVVIKIPDATPGIVAKYSLNDEQALLSKLRYNRLIDIFTGVTCHSLQNHLRTSIPGIGQVETDELYVGVDRRGVHYIFPVQAKGGGDEIGVVQIEQDLALCEHKFPRLVCRAIAAQFMAENIIALFELELQDGSVRKVAEHHYKLVPPDQLSDEELDKYRHWTRSP